MKQEDKSGIKQSKIKLESNNKIDFSFPSYRQIRPSVFLNEISFLPSISPQVSKNKLEVPISKNEELNILNIKSADNVPFLPVLEDQFGKIKPSKHKPTKSMPTQLSQFCKNQNEEDFYKKDNGKKDKINLKLVIQSPNPSIHIIEHKQKKNVQFRKSIFIVDILNGVYQKGTIDGSKKPVRKLVKSRLSKCYF